MTAAPLALATLGPIGMVHYLAVSLWLFVWGVYCVVTRRNAVALLMGVELLLNAAALNFVAFSHYGPGRIAGHVVTLFVIVLAAAEAAIALAIVLVLYQTTGSIQADEATRLRE